MPDLPTLSVVLVHWNRRQAALAALERFVSAVPADGRRARFGGRDEPESG